PWLTPTSPTISSASSNAPSGPPETPAPSPALIRPSHRPTTPWLTSKRFSLSLLLLSWTLFNFSAWVHWRLRPSSLRSRSLMPYRPTRLTKPVVETRSTSNYCGHSSPPPFLLSSQKCTNYAPLLALPPTVGTTQSSTRSQKNPRHPRSRTFAPSPSRS